MIIWREQVHDDWIDYNGHLTEGYYGVVFGNATDAVFDAVGLDAAYRNANDSSVYTVEAHVRFLAEVPPGVELEVRSSVIGVTTKLLRIWHEMWLDDRVCATQESLGLHVTARRSAPFPAEVAARIAATVVEAPAEAGRSIRKI